MLTKVEITNAKGDVLALPLADFSGGYLVTDIEGLDPVKATLTSSQMAQVDGAQAQSARRETRNITGKIELKPNYSTNSVDSLRQQLYKYLMPKSFITMGFYKDDVLYATTQGQVESLENSMFAQDPEMDFSVICYDPDFYAPSTTTVSGSTVSTLDTETITYNGTTECGIIFTLNVDRTIAGFTLSNTQPDGTSQVFDLEAPFADGDVVVITSVPLQKSVIRTTDSVPTSVLYGVQAGSAWISLANGDNDFRASVAGDAIDFTIQYVTKYGAL